MHQPLVFFDVETSGLHPGQHEILELAAVVRGAGGQIHAFQRKVLFDMAKADKAALEHNHFDAEAWELEARPPGEVALDFADWLRPWRWRTVVSRKGKSFTVATLAAHNAAFDNPFLQAMFRASGVFLPASPLVLCTLQRAMWRAREDPSFTPADFKLGTLAAYLGVTHETAHEAGSDALAAMKVYEALTETTPCG